MGVYASIVDFNQLHNSSVGPIVYVNEFDITDPQAKEQLGQYLYTHYEGDTLSVVPQCYCGSVKGSFNVGVRCSRCNEVVQTVTERPLESVLWIKPPTGVEVFINPTVWVMFSKRLTHSGVNMFRWLVDPTMSVPEDKWEKISKDFLNEERYPRGLNAFYHHFDQILNHLKEDKLFSGDRQKVERFIQFVQRYRNQVFAHALPIPAKQNFITEKAVTETYVDEVMKHAVDAILTVSQTEHAVVPLSHRRVMGKAVKANEMLARYYDQYIQKHMVGKKGWFRKNLFGSRLPFTARAVIVSISGPHRYDAVELPWTLSIGLFKLHLAAKLLHRNYTPVDALRLINENALQYHPLIDELFQELVREGNLGCGCAILLNRNPSLLRGFENGSR